MLRLLTAYVSDYLGLRVERTCAPSIGCVARKVVYTILHESRCVMMGNDRELPSQW